MHLSFKKSKRSTNQRFFEKVEMIPFHACWEWTGALNSDGYGWFFLSRDEKGRSKNVKAHRYSWSVYNGRIPSGMCILHECDNRSCVNPSHLRAGTQLDNIRDMNKKGRRAPPINKLRDMMRLNENQIKEIKLCLKREASVRSISLLYGISRYTVVHLAKQEGCHRSGPRGAPKPNSNSEQVSKIKALYSEGWTQKNIGLKFGLSQSQISSIVLNKSWKKR